MKRLHVFFLFSLTLFLSLFSISSLLYSKDIRIVTPYLGKIKNIYENKEQDLDLEDSSLMKGLYLQWIGPEKYQWNVFVYQSSDINLSTLWGAHFIFDYYYDVQRKHKNVIGTGFEMIRINMDAENNFTPLSDFTLVNNIYAVFIRTGRYFLFGSRNIDYTLLPWLGFELESVRGDISFVPPGPPTTEQEDIKSDYVFSIAGLNFKSRIYHFIEFEVKYAAHFNCDDFLSDVSTMTNIYVSRHWAASYRFKYMENIFGSNRYHIWGVAYVF
jgi:hypothetical protein